MSKASNKAVLLILDGWGLGKGDHTDGVAKADTPNMDQLMSTQPNTTLKTHGENVGLPKGQMGNSEVGHLNIGAGRVVYQMLARINKSFEDRSILKEDQFKNFLKTAKNTKGKIHLMGLVSNGGVHSSDEHLKALCGLLKENDLDDRTYIHVFLDGRDCDPNSGYGFVKDVIKDPRLGQCAVASVTGRYYAMDRDNRWERIKLAYDAVVNGLGHKFSDPLEGIKASYDEGITDEFVKPIVVYGYNEPLASISEGDIVLCFNFRTDRGRQITTALTQRSFHEQNMHPLNVDYFTFTEYDKTFKDVNSIFHKEDLKMTMGEHLEKLGKTQLRGAETEKYPHVTYFFSGGRESEFKGEKRILIASPKVATYDLQPEMSAPELKNAVISELQTGDTDFFCVNFANPDMVGHTGVFDAIKIACETVDGCVGDIVAACKKHSYKLLIIADHGNADNAINLDGSANTAHSTNPVPCIILGEGEVSLNSGILADVAPTILKMMGLPQPVEMTGSPLF